MAPIRIFTIGHSTHELEEFVGMLRANGVQRLIDVRTVPGSRHNPQFGQDELEKSMPASGVDYEWMKQLGGLRRTTKDSVNGGWRNASFRGYADYMQTEEFDAGIAELTERAGRQVVAIMCAEAVPWRCHRSLIGDAMLARGAEVLDIMSPTSTTPRTMTKFAKVDGTRVTYPPYEDASAAP